MDKKYGVYWHVIVGEGFGFEVSYETKNMLYLFFAGNLGIKSYVNYSIIVHYTDYNV